MSKESVAKIFLGLDLGSVSLNCVIMDECHKVIFKKYMRNNGNPLNTLKRLFEDIENGLGDISFSGAVITGSGKELVAKVANFGTINEIVAHAKAAWTLHPDVKTVFEIGGQDSKYIEIGKTDDGKYYLKDHTFNELCAAGTGAFLDQQAQRLGISIEELSKMAFNARVVPSVAGRCSVFAKSDMIHLQQKAVPTDEIAAGLCFALVRNYIAAICKGRKTQLPIVFQGGVAANKGVARAFKEILDLKEKDFIIPSDHSVTGAYGSALTALENPLENEVSISELVKIFDNAASDPEPSSDLPVLKFSMFPEVVEPVGIENSTGHLFMGIDVGSVSTKGVIIDSRQRLVASTYLPTAGKPVEAIKKLVNNFKNLTKKNIAVAHIAFTGSGRHLAKALFGGGTVMDEISAQSISSARFFPDTDTIIEIGGQDSKFIKMSDGKVKAFKMNRACAAGTGSFLEEQAGRLGIEIKNDFADMAFKSTNPVRLGSRCTVFMDSDLVHHIQRGAKKEDLCAGLAYSVAENYLEKVAGSTTVGENIVFQGGVAKNSALHAVFENLTGKSVKIHPYPEISGALGAAFTAFDEVEKENTGFGFSLSLLNVEAVTDSFVCNTCENLCEIRRVTVQNGEKAFFGSVCGRYEKGVKSAIPPEDSFKMREKLLFECGETGITDFPRGEIGIPFSLTIYDYLPFWKTFFSKLGYKVTLSDRSTKKIVKSGLIHVPGEFCYPVKVLYGHIYNLTRSIFNKKT
jgi:predicted CoA-substrate-specific enzyme activase